MSSQHHVGPTLGHVHVHLSRGTPHPVFLRTSLLEPFHAREVESQPPSFLERVVEAGGNGLPGDGHLHRPSTVGVGGIIECAVTVYRRLESRTVPLHEEVAVHAIGAVEHKVEDRVESVELYLEICPSVTVGIDEHLEVVVLIDDGIALLEQCLDIGFFQFGPYVEKVVVPKHFGPCAVFGAWETLPTDVDKGGRIGCTLPFFLVEQPVDCEGRLGFQTNVGGRRGKHSPILLHEGCPCLSHPS